jgi:hypothetical protein
MVQKAAAIGAPIIVAISAPTALAVRTAQTAGAQDDANTHGLLIETHRPPTPINGSTRKSDEREPDTSLTEHLWRALRSSRTAGHERLEQRGDRTRMRFSVVVSDA